MDKRGKLLIAFCSVLLITVGLFLSGFEMQTINYSVTTDKLSGEVRIAFISDLHNCFYGGKDQSELMKAIDDSEPDIVIFGGDVLDAWGGTEYSLRIMEMAAEKYPCCYTPGNHETMRDDMDSFVAQVSELGVNVVMGNYWEIQLSAGKIRIYGAVDRNYKDQLKNCFKTLDGSYYNIFLGHQPEQFKDYLNSEKVRFDLVLSGHSHGGQWRIPVILEQGLYSPDQGIFPEKTCGTRTDGDSLQIISRGLAKPARMFFIPRIFNRPEFSVITING